VAGCCGNCKDIYGLVNGGELPVKVLECQVLKENSNPCERIAVVTFDYFSVYTPQILL
jgi:hypothetical protein